MKKSKIFKRISVIALSAVMTAGVALAAAACGGGGGGGTNEEGYRNGLPNAITDSNVLSVYIFCNTSDAETNRAICEEWMDKYNAANGTTHTVSVTTIDDKEQYFKNVNSYYANNTMYDVLYLAPRYVRTYAETGSVLNLADYLDTISADPALKGDAAKAANQEVLGEIWKNATSYYAYQRGKSMGADAYTLGQPVHYDSDQNGFYTDAGDAEVGLYGLPKDYSNFSTSYNNLFFTQEMKEKITTTLSTDRSKNVQGAENETSGSVSKDRVYNKATGAKNGLVGTGNGQNIIQYAVSGTYTNPYTGDSKTVTAGDPAPIINVGVPTRYFPFNFFRYNNYNAALKGGDPLACLCEAYTGGEGYVVTIPGFPNDELKIPDGAVNYQNKDEIPFDTTIGHVTYTYAEYSAFIWAMTYYLNTFDWQNGDGHGGISYGGGNYKTVFGGEQYEGKSAAAVGSVLYLLPWLFGNDADLIDATNQYCTQLESGKVIGEGADIPEASGWKDMVGQATNAVSKMNLDGTYRTVDVQYGYNSQKFIETYGAFLALASDWNANNGGDSDTDSTNNGWAYFRAGRCLFYGAGSWDGATRNDTHPDMLEFGQMPTPISEDYALYSKIKGANYEMVEYSNGATSKGTGADAGKNDKQQRSNLKDGLKMYTQEEIVANQIIRQDKWGARMDSVGYAVNGQVTNYTDNHAWKKEAAVSLVMALTIDRDAQISLTYAGAQYPNFRDQMEQFVNYQDYGEEGAFKDMVTPEGYSNMKYYKADGSVDETVAAQAKKIWDKYYEIAMDMEKLAVSGSTQTVSAYLADQKVEGENVKYDPTYADVQLKDFAGSTTTSRLAYAMKTLRMIPMTRVNREINIRMQYGLNAARDSTMYTFSDEWVAAVDARTAHDTMLAYTNGMSIKVGSTIIDGTVASSLDALRAGIKQNPTRNEQTWETPVLFCLRLSKLSQDTLMKATNDERVALSSLS